MKNLSKWVSGLAASVLLAGTASATDTVSDGKVKAVNAQKKEFVLTDGAGKDQTFKLGTDVVVNRGGKEGPSDLRADDAVSVCYDKGTFTWTANYILVKEGGTKGCALVPGAFKQYDTGTKAVTFTDREGKDVTHNVNGATVRLNMHDAKIEDIKIGDHALAIVEQAGDKAALKALMFTRK